MTAGKPATTSRATARERIGGDAGPYHGYDHDDSTRYQYLLHGGLLAACRSLRES
jgi:hypothetical protein